MAQHMHKGGGMRSTPILTAILLSLSLAACAPAAEDDTFFFEAPADKADGETLHAVLLSKDAPVFRGVAECDEWVSCDVKVSLYVSAHEQQHYDALAAERGGNASEFFITVLDEVRLQDTVIGDDVIRRRVLMRYNPLYGETKGQLVLQKLEYDAVSREYVPVGQPEPGNTIRLSTNPLYWVEVQLTAPDGEGALHDDANFDWDQHPRLDLMMSVRWW